jgi:hypothetical protein
LLAVARDSGLHEIEDLSGFRDLQELGCGIEGTNPDWEQGSHYVELLGLVIEPNGPTVILTFADLC